MSIPVSGSPDRTRNNHRGAKARQPYCDMFTRDRLHQQGFSGSSLREIVLALRAGRITACDLYGHARHQHTALEARLHGHVAWNETLAASQARAADAAFEAGCCVGTLQGIPISIKDIFGLDGYDLKAGSSRALPEKFAAEGQFVGSMRRQLAVFTGKTQTDEFAYAGLGTVNDGPIPRNPWDASAHRVAGGSSSGAPLSLWQETALVAVASDTSGSVRRPAALTGTAGLKLTVGRWPTDDMLPLCPTMDTPGILARTVDDLRFAFHALDPVANDPSVEWQQSALRPGTVTLGICSNHMWDECDPGVAEAVWTAIDELKLAGAQCTDVLVPEISEVYRVLANGGIVSSEFMAFIENEVPEWLDTLQPQLRARLAGPDRSNLSASAYLRNRRDIERCARAVTERLADVDVLVGPTMPITAPTLEQVESASDWQEANRRAVRNTYIASLLGLCGLSIPVGLDANGVPVGMQLLAKPWQEEQLLDMACLFERILGNWSQRLGRPALLDCQPKNRDG